MIRILPSTAETRNPRFKNSPRKAGEDNVAWLARAMGEHKRGVPVVLLGGRGPCSFRLRVAQSHARHDMTPSHWSHVLLLDGAGAPSGTSELREISLEKLVEPYAGGPSSGWYPPASNGLAKGRSTSTATRGPGPTWP